MLVLVYNGISKDYEQLVYKGSIKFEKIVEFLKPFAAPERLLKQPEKMDTTPTVDTIPRPDIKELTAGNFENEIRSKTDGVFVHFTKGEDHPAWDDSVNKFQ